MHKNLKLNIEDNNLKCFLIIERDENNEVSISRDDIVRFLADEKITHGIKEDIIDKIVDTGNTGTFLIAEGKEIEEGEDGSVTYLIDENKENKDEKTSYIKQGDKLVDIKLAKKSIDGFDVYGKVSKGKETKEFDIFSIIGLGLEYDDKNSCIIAATNGSYLKNNDGTISIIEKNIVNLEVSTDKLTCTLIIDEFSQNIFTKLELDKALEEEKVIAGLKNDILKKLTETTNFETDRIIIAEAIPPIKGDDGFIEYIIEDKRTIEYNENEVADFYNIDTIINVTENEILAKIFPPKDGKNGENIYGSVINAKKGEEFNHKQILGDGVNFIESENIIKASINGIYEKNAVGLISVVDEYRISEDVDFEVGNIETTSALEIGGDIKAGFRVKSDSNINVNGVIEDAEIICGNNLVCKLGIISGSWLVTAKNTIRAKYINERECESTNIFVKSGITNSKLKVTDSIEADKIIGGILNAKNRIEVKELGSSQFIETQIIMGQNYKVSEKIDENRKKISTLAKELKLSEIKLYRDKKDYNIISTKISSFGNSGSSNKSLLNSLAIQSKELQKKIELRRNKIKNSFEIKMKSLENLNSKLKDKLNEISSPELIVKKTVYPNVKIRMKNSLIYEVKNEISGVRFKLSNDANEVIMLEIGK